MAKLILRTNLIDETFNVEFKSIDVPINEITTPNPVNLKITPIAGKAVQVEHFSIGGLPSEIKSIVFSSFGKDILATVSFNSFTLTQGFNNIYLPISGHSVLSNNAFVLRETTKTDENVFITDKSAVNGDLKSSGNPTIKEYNLQAEPNDSVVVINKVFSVPDGYYFSQTPSQSISGPGSENYSINKQNVRDAIGRVIKTTISISYNFPETSFAVKTQDNLSFSYQVNKITLTNEEQTQQNTKTEKIYSIDTGVTPGAGGGTKFIVIKGVPGTPFRILVQDNIKRAYDFSTGIFGGTGGKNVLEGIIPPARSGVGYGVYKDVVIVPPSEDGLQIVTNTIPTEVDHEALAIQYDNNNNEVSTQAAQELIVDTALLKASLNLALHTGTETSFIPSRLLLIDDEPDDANDLIKFLSTYYLKNGRFEISGIQKESIHENLELKPFTTSDSKLLKSISFVVQANAVNKYIRINRQPLFDSKAKFVRWDSAFESSDTKSFNSDGLEILTDWGNITANPDETIDYGSYNLKMKVGAQGDGGTVLHGVSGALDLVAYEYVIISISLEGTFGTGTIIPELNLTNFLSIHSL